VTLYGEGSQTLFDIDRTRLPSNIYEQSPDKALFSTTRGTNTRVGRRSVYMYTSSKSDFLCMPWKQEPSTPTCFIYY